MKTDKVFAVKRDKILTVIYTNCHFLSFFWEIASLIEESYVEKSTNRYRQEPIRWAPSTSCVSDKQERPTNLKVVRT